jgi:hypothetical protein
MALPLVEASKLSNTVVSQGIVETFVKDDPILARLNFETIVGNSYQYNRELSMAAAQFYGVNEEWVSSYPTADPKTAVPKIVGSPVELDDFLKKTRSNITDLKQELIDAAIKATKFTFMDSVFYGNATTNPKQFDGLHVLVSDTTYNTLIVDSGDTQTVPLQMAGHLDKAIDMIKGFKPSLIVSSRQMRRNVNKYLRGVGAGATATKDEFGNLLEHYGTIPWAVSDYITDTELTSSGAYSAKTGGLTTSIFILSFDPKAFYGMQVEPMNFVPWTIMTGTNKEWANIRWYPTILVKSLVSCAKIVGIDADGTVAA